MAQSWNSRVIISILIIFEFNICIGTPSNDHVIESSPQKSAIKEKDQFVSLVIENDSFFTNEDDGYTSGVLLSYFNSGAKHIKLAEWLNRHVPFISFNEYSKISYSIGQNIYVPRDISIPDEQKNDRPWAGFMYGTIRALTLTDKYVDDLEVTVGVVGPAALGEEAQKFVHSILSSPKPKGWKHQLKNEPGIVLTWGRRMLNVLTTEIKPLSLVFEPNVIANLGNVYTTGEVGAIVRLMPISSSWVDTPLLIRPAMPGSSFFYSKNNNIFNWYAFTGIQARGVLRNIFLDGNTFKSSADIEKKPFVFDFNTGAALMYNNIRLSYTFVYRTKEFHKQNYSSVYSNVNISYSL